MQMMPNNANVDVNKRPTNETGVTSPQPIVVALTNENHRDFNMDPKWSGSSPPSTRYMMTAKEYVTIARRVSGKNVFAG